MKKQEPLHQEQQTVKGGTPISRLQNSIYYFLDCVFIVHTDGDYRLVILHHDRVIMDAHYNTLRGAKIAFAKFFNEKAWTEGVQPQWSPSYPPEPDWLNEKLDILEKAVPLKRFT